MRGRDTKPYPWWDTKSVRFLQRTIQQHAAKASRSFIIFGKVIPHLRKSPMIIHYSQSKGHVPGVVWHHLVQPWQSSGVCLEGPLAGPLAYTKNAQSSWCYAVRTPSCSGTPSENLEAVLRNHTLLPSSGPQVLAPSQGGKLASE